MTSQVKRDSFSNDRRKRYIKYVAFFRENPNLFIKHYLGINLFPYQKLWIYMLQRSETSYAICARAIGKTWLIALWSSVLCILYPGLKVVVVSKTIKQSSIILSEKLRSMIKDHPNLAREIESITTNANTNECIFKNGSSITIVPASENARGRRASYIVVDESRLVSKEILEQVIKPFLSTRTPPYKSKPEYQDKDDLKEEARMTYITSAGYKSEYYYEYVKGVIRRMMRGDDSYGFIALDYRLTIKHGIKTKRSILSELADMEPLTVQMEYYNIPAGQSGKSYYTFSMFKRTMKRAFYPQRNDAYNEKKNPFSITKTNGEIRIISVDVATRANKNNDLTIISCARLIPMMGKGYKRQLVYMESHKGKNTILQARRIKEIFFDFESDYLVLDLQNIGIGIFDSLSQVTPNEERGIEYPPMTVANHENIDGKLQDELVNRTLGANPIPVIFPILASPSLNSAIAVAFRSSLQKKLWEFLVSDNDAEEYLIKTYKDYMTTDSDSYRSFYLNPYVNTNLLIGECVNLDMTLSGGMIKLAEKDGNYKDRYSSVSYLNYVAGLFDKDLLKESDNTSDEEAILAVSMIY